MEIEIYRGTTNNFAIVIIDQEEGGVRYTPKKGDIIHFGVSKKTNGSELLLVKSAPVSEDGSAYITIKPEDTETMCCDNYYYDIGLESGDDYYIIAPPAAFRLKRNITRRGCNHG